MRHLIGMALVVLCFFLAGCSEIEVNSYPYRYSQECIKGVVYYNPIEDTFQKSIITVLVDKKYNPTYCEGTGSLFDYKDKT